MTEMSEIRFDPQTGEPIAPQTPQAPAPAPKKSNAGKIIACVVAAAVVIGGGAFAVKNLVGGGGRGVFGKGTPYEQIKAASEATFVADDMTGQIKAASEIMEDGKYAFDINGDVSGQDVKAQIDADKGNYAIKVAAMGMEGTLYFDEEKVTLDASSLGIDPLSYSYTADKADAADSYVGSMIGTDNLEQVDSLLKMVYSIAATNKADKEEIEKAIDEKFESLEYEELEEEEFKVGDDTIKCGGFSTTVSGEFLAELIDEVAEKSYGKSLTDLVDELSAMGVDTGDVTDPLAQVKEMEDIDLQFYINEGKLAQISFQTKADDQDIDGSVQFAGEDIPWHEMYIVNNAGEGEASLIAHEDGSVTTYELASNGSTEGTVEYDKDSGDLTVYSGDEVVFKGTIEGGKDEVTFSVQEMSDQDVDATVVISDDVDVAKAPEAQDILSMSAADFAKIGTVISKLMYGL